MAGFYGNATSSAKVNLTFDIVYPNRKKMDSSAATDGVYSGRYVLVEYGNSDVSENTNTMQLLYRDDNNNFYYSPSITSQKWTGQDAGDIYKVLGPDAWKPEASLPDNQHYEIWVRVVVDSTNPSKDILRQVTTATSGSLGYAANYGFDKEAYAANNNAFRGYDSTVWQKTYADGESKYVMIAELNSVIPTFNIKVDAPSYIPQPPHFDSNKTNVYYDMHLAPSWGFRIKKAGEKDPSDLTGDYYEYNPDAVDINEAVSVDENANLSIYFGREDFLEYPEGHNKYDPNDKVNLVNNNYIKIEGAASGRRYESTHTDSEVSTATVQNDIQELSISLPAIGQVVKKAWDIVHGPDRDDGTTTSLQGRLDAFGKLGDNQIPVIQGAGGELTGANVTDDNMWIATEVNAATGKFHIAHDYNPGQKDHIITNVEDMDNSYGTNQNTSIELETSGEFSFATPRIDAKGHIIGANKYDVKLPNSLQNISVSGFNLGNTIPTGQGGTITANTYKTTFSLKPGNKWINLTANNTDKSIVISHGSAGTQASQGNPSSSNNSTPKFGETFKVLGIGVDAAGHITSTSPYSIKIPLPSLKKENATSHASSVIVNSSLDADDGKLTLTSDDVDNLIIKNYNNTVSTHSNAIVNTDSIKGAFEKSQANLDSEITRASQAETNLGNKIDGLVFADSGVNSGQYVASVTQDKGLISVARGNVGTLTLTGYIPLTSVDNNGELAATHNVNEAFGRLEYRIKDTINTINGLTYSETADNTQIITQITQQNGKITNVSRAGAGTLVLGNQYISPKGIIAATDSLNTAFGTIETKLAQLDTALSLLTNDSDPNDLDSVADLIKWVGDHGDTVKDITDAIQANTDAIGVAEEVDESGNIIQAATGLRKDLVDLKAYVDRDIVITSDQGEELTGTIKTIFDVMLTRINTLEEMCQIHSLGGSDSAEENGGSLIGDSENGE